MREGGKIPDGVWTDVFLVADEETLADESIGPGKYYKVAPAMFNVFRKESKDMVRISTPLMRAIHPGDDAAAMPVPKEGKYARFDGEISFPLPRQFNEATEALEVAKAFPDQIRGKTVMITGVNVGGLGFTTAQAFASQSPAHVIIVGRTPEKLQASLDALRAEFPDVDFRSLQIELGIQKSVRVGAAEFLSWTDVPELNILVNNAGIMCVPERTITTDGIEITFATNHIGHWLLANLIMPKLIKASVSNPKGTTRVVNVSSGLTTGIRWSDINFEKANKDLPAVEQPPYELFRAFGYTDVEEKSYLPLDGYNRSKTANILFGVAANKMLYDKYGIVTMALHPGAIFTELSRNFSDKMTEALEVMMNNGVFSWRSQGAGAATSLVASLDPKLGVGIGEMVNGSDNYGAFMYDCQISDKAGPLAVSSEEADRLWKLSEELVKQEFNW
ncbi:related to double substrate-specificity short chain dehydrogenase/reductase 2 [Cephalotrichum gorgonifer]|uniref:Related to double substrate-specificity short chain dehydrogenase/reductase 2 n=1 Tax=Cephalotrichum gorgonifer TaxID=2041049 RepID=A0AAE8MS97_9PEZI|nr:related to double substrate-specificity short chain dehydrogenase/reductase 2 [Cephalotrichum gorgonifer]